MNPKNALIKHPEAWIPLGMSMAALSLVACYLVIFGIAQQPPEDEGTAAHIFQLLIAGQLPIMTFFAIKWLPQQSKQALRILVLQTIAVIIALAPIFLLELLKIDLSPFKPDNLFLV